MTSCEIMKRAIEFAHPERVLLDNFLAFGLSDTYEICEISLSKKEDLGEGREKDEWGCTRQKPSKDSGIINEGYFIEFPLMNASLKDLKIYPFPDSRESSRYSHLEQILSKEEINGKYVWFGDFYTLFERCWALRGMEQVFIDLYGNKKFLHELLDHITDFHLGVLENLKHYTSRIHGYHIGDDWGSQNGILISLDHFREYFKPRYKKIIEAAHSIGMHVRLHSDGKINDLIEEFIDIGLDVIEINSPKMLGIDEVARRFRGRICFEVCVDIQRTLPRGNRDEIEAEVKELIEKWGTERGGIIALNYGGWDCIGVTEEEIKMAFNAFLKYGKY